jgi:RHS repeat-associated protein
VDKGATANYVYNALNQRVQTMIGGTVTEFVFNATNQRVSEWSGTSPYGALKGHYYWGSLPLAYYGGGSTHFEHQDWTGTERMRTSYTGSVEAKFTNLPWGDSQQQIKTGGLDTDAYHYSMLDHDTETETDHAQFRQYNSLSGQWLSPDPYTGSYDSGNPQSFNRYVYALNNPLSNIDPIGLDYCTVPSGQGGYDPSTGSIGGWNDTSSPSGCAAAGGQWVVESTPPGYSSCGTDSSGYSMYCDSDGNIWVNNDPSSTGSNDGSGYGSGGWFGSGFGFGGSGFGDGGDGSSGGGGGGAANNATIGAAPSQPWYKNTCVTNALLSGAGSAAIDSIGLIPEGGAVAGAFSLFHGAAGVSNGINIVQRVKAGAGIIGSANSLNEGSAISTALGVAGFIPGLGQLAAGASIVNDAIKTGMAVAQCP